MIEDSVSSIPSIWASMNSWFTPAVFFVLLNIMIVTIAFTSSLANQKYDHHQKTTNDDGQQQIGLARAPSVLQRLKSINFYNYRSKEPHTSPPIAAHFHDISDSDVHFAPEQKAETHKFFQEIPYSDSHFAPEKKIETQNFSEQTIFDQTSDSDTLYTPNQSHFEGEEPTLDEVYSQLKDRHVHRTNSDTKPVGGEMPEKLPARMRKSASAKSAFAHFEENDVVEARRPATVREGNGRVTEEDDEEVDSKADNFINKFKQQLKLQRIDSIIRYKDGISRGSGK